DGVNGFGKYVNATGGLAGRKVQVDFIDSKLNPNEARNAVIKACAEDFALVGTAAIFLNQADDEINCVDAAGKATGLPDLGGRDPNSVYTPIIQNMKNSNSNYSLAAQAVNGVVAMRQEAQLQGLTDPKIIWQCTLACYEAPVFLDGGDAVNGEYMAMSFLPFD